MSTLASLKTIDNGLEVEYEVLTSADIDSPISKERAEILSELSDIEICMSENQKIIDSLSSEIDRLTNHADGLDYTIAVSSGIITGLIDAFFVGEFNWEALKADAHKHVNSFIEKFAKLNGYDGNGRLAGAIDFLEDKFPVAQDNVWSGKKISSARLHHLEDLAHHPTPIGLLAAFVVTLFNVGIFVDKDGHYHFPSANQSPKQMLKVWLPILIAAILMWLVNLAKSGKVEQYEKLPKPIKKLITSLAAAPAVIEVLMVSYNWLGHLVSDMGGSKNTPGGGMGISGIFISLLKEIASLPGINKTGLNQVVSDLYSKEKIDMRAEIAICEYLGKQAMPVIINECLVRTFYFVRHLIEEKKNREWSDVNWKNTIPFNNRTIARMMTIASGTFVAVDTADAAIRAGIKSGGEPATFLTNFVLRINFVGIGRFAISVGNDLRMGYKRGKARNERLYRQSEQIMLQTAKVYYKQSDMWLTAKDTAETINKMEEVATKSITYFRESLAEIGADLENMESYRSGIDQYNPTLLDDINTLLKYGK